MLTQPMETTLSPQANTPLSPNNHVVTAAHLLGDDHTELPGGDPSRKGVVTTVVKTLGKRGVGRDTGPDRGPREDRGVFGGR